MGCGDGKGRKRNSSPVGEESLVRRPWREGAQITRENSYRCALFTSVITWPSYVSTTGYRGHVAGSITFMIVKAAWLKLSRKKPITVRRSLERVNVNLDFGP